MPGASYIVSSMSAASCFSAASNTVTGCRLGAQARVGEFENRELGHGPEMRFAAAPRKIGRYGILVEFGESASVARPAPGMGARRLQRRNPADAQPALSRQAPDTGGNRAEDGGPPGPSPFWDGRRFLPLKFRIDSPSHWGIRELAAMLKKLLAVSAGLLLTLTVFAATVQPSSGQSSIRTAISSGRATRCGTSRRASSRSRGCGRKSGRTTRRCRNPHLIYPGDELVLSSGHVRHGEGSIGPHARITSLEDAVKPIPLSALKQFLKQARVVSEDEFKHAPHVVGIEENQLRGTPGQLAYVRGLDAQPGDEVRDRAPGRPLLRHAAARRRPAARGLSPDAATISTAVRACSGATARTNSRSRGNVRFLGYEVLDFGTVEVTRVGDPSSVLITYSDFEVRPGDLVLPIEEQPYDDQYVPHAPAHVPDNMRVAAWARCRTRATGIRRRSSRTAYGCITASR